MLRWSKVHIHTLTTQYYLQVFTHSALSVKRLSYPAFPAGVIGKLVQLLSSGIGFTPCWARCDTQCDRHRGFGDLSQFLEASHHRNVDVDHASVAGIDDRDSSGPSENKEAIHVATLALKHSSSDIFNCCRSYPGAPKFVGRNFNILANWRSTTSHVERSARSTMAMTRQSQGRYSSNSDSSDLDELDGSEG